MIDNDRRVIRLGDFVYSIDLLAEGLETPEGTLCKITKSEPGPDGERSVLFQLWDHKP